MASAAPHFLASRAKARGVIAHHVEEYYATLPERPNLADLARWFRVCQWNARASLYDYFIELIREQCQLQQGKECSLHEARAHLGEFLAKSARQVERYQRQQPFPAVRNGNGNGARNGRA